ncbi:uncharacterized protein LOC128200603 [Galleria mellonella]|uniref:Uncharacterized protein LOC128200603 n=1 Tax=Galleria mellonella TaxID=7137 RepID=A0ABM3MH65_GALME|nr:uncharacterized protein LOC128200603 [Galleria mellonella]
MFTTILLFCSLNVLTDANESPLIIKLKPEQVIDIFKSVLSSKYLKELANDIAGKAAQHFLDEMKNKEKQSTSMPRGIKEIKENSAELTVLNEQQAMTLLNDPSPDGDNLETDDTNLSEDEAKKVKARIPVFGMLKINGIYYRRFLGLL